MALYPCSIGQHRYAGRQQSIYVVDGVGRDATMYKLRLCGQHMQDVLRGVTLTPEDDVSPTQLSMFCEICGAPRTHLLFLSVFAGNEPRLVATLERCDSCARPWQVLSESRV